MKQTTRYLLYFILPIIAVLSFPPAILLNALPLLAFTVVVFILLGYLLMRGSSRALTLTIFIQGLNVIVRSMMFFPHSFPSPGAVDGNYIIFNLLGMALSFYLMLRLDQLDVRAQLVT